MPTPHDALIEAALAAKANAYAPYSKFQVGAALLDRAGRIHLGCNVENASYGLTICAERSALTAAVTAGAREFEAIAIATDAHRLTPPCGACRQMLTEFAPTLPIVLVGPGGVAQHDLAELLPLAFGPDWLAQGGGGA